MYQNYPYNIILASASPRRSELLAQLGFRFSIEIKSIDESYDPFLSPSNIALQIVSKKMEAFNIDNYSNDTIIITADTVVSLNGKILGKPQSHYDAKIMLQSLSDKEHEVITAVCLKSNSKMDSFFETTKVQFSSISDAEIDFYINQFNPLDKAGSYGIQEWIGLGFIKAINGSYTNVVGLPTEALRRAFIRFVDDNI